MKNINLCAVAMSSTMDGLIQQLLLIQEEVPIVEIRTDY